MSSERRKELLEEYKSIKEREVAILAELFESHLEVSDQVPVTNQTTKVKVGDKVKILSGGVNSRWGDEGVVVRLTEKRCEIKLSRNRALIKRAYNKIERV